MDCPTTPGSVMCTLVRDTRGSLTAEMAVVAGACVIVMIMMANVCLFLIRAGQFDRISAEVARECAYRDTSYSAQAGIEEAMGLSSGSRFTLFGEESAGGVCTNKQVTFILEYRPLFDSITIGSLSIRTPTFQRTKSYAVPAIGYEVDSP